MICYSKLQPRGGLGNKIFVWCYGLVFSQRNNCEHHTSKWAVLHFGPMVRGEQSFRIYLGSFKEDSLVKKVRLKLYKAQEEKILYDKDIELLVNDKLTNIKYTFYKVGDNWHTVYHLIKPYRDLIKKELYRKLTARVLKKIEGHKAPWIGVHIRRGDFKPPKSEEGLTIKSIAIQTSNHYFISVIDRIRKFVNLNIPVTIFSDGKPKELENILSLPNVSMAKDDLDIVHMLLLSRSKIIVISEGSTFGGWSAYLSEAVIIRNPAMYKTDIRPDELNTTFFEGILPIDTDSFSPLLRDNLGQIKEALPTSVLNKSISNYSDQK